MDARSPETLAIAALLFVGIAFSTAGHKHFSPKPEAAASQVAEIDGCQVLGKSEVATLVGQSVSDARALPGLGGPDCYYSLSSPHTDLLVRWIPGAWAQETATFDKLGAAPLSDVGAPAMWIPSENAVEAQAPGGRILFVGFWSDHGMPLPMHEQQLATAVARAALARAGSPTIAP